MSESQAAVAMSDVITNALPLRFAETENCQIRSVQLQTGVELVSWCGHFQETVEMELRDDTDRIHFSFNNRLDGRAACRFDMEGNEREYRVEEGSGNISFGQGRTGRYLQQGHLHNVTVMVRPDIVNSWLEPDDKVFCKLLQRGSCYVGGHRSGELRATAQTIEQAMNSATPGAIRHHLWLQGQAMTMVSLFLEAHRARFGAPVDREKKLLLAARDILLSDLSKAPSLSYIASEAGMSASRLERGFRQFFGTSVYGLFQRERMHVARLRLYRDEAPVTQVALDLGYSNISHFAAAFKKQFGLNPSAFKQTARSGNIGRP
ncbi:hypothetical protein BVH06_07520 [Pseudomonas sp. PA27(2017)]|nr:hypothetical protein BVH06_07520 [Pseudomonas sp. PA27(2017)]